MSKTLHFDMPSLGFIISVRPWAEQMAIHGTHSFFYELLNIYDLWRQVPPERVSYDP